MRDITIVRLNTDSDHVATVASWTYAEWGHLNPAYTAETWREAFRRECGDGGVPSVFVAMQGDRPVGTAALMAEDMASRRDLTPWLASVFVLPEWRGQGIAARLIRRVEEEAAACGIDQFYLYTHDQQGLYRRLGWCDHEILNYRGEEVTIMLRRLEA
ncbi:GNAT family N-acetyltransferase [Halomonas chromatireducens]|uniref:Acetyltransferase (GNAT) family protein n=1 Tax=Halomonas chromatireducens TaxID=507626 RepID=A0A0X8HB35_9GAMM|nr:GNAT family N-acetyltransferase [Halomonas chromatireducens]AMC99383.1 Acetyltransferase (GNAT) family protein [Halomonas chromatireducens]